MKTFKLYEHYTSPVDKNLIICLDTEEIEDKLYPNNYVYSEEDIYNIPHTHCDFINTFSSKDELVTLITEYVTDNFYYKDEEHKKQIITNFIEEVMVEVEKYNKESQR